MKIYTVTSEEKTREFQDAETKQVIIPSKTVYTIQVNQEAINFLQNNGGSTVDRIKYLILHFWNVGSYPLNNMDLLGMIRNADAERQELIISIFEMCTHIYRDECFKVLDEVAPLFKDEFKTKEEQ
jgi:hypothetical protein